MRRKSHQFPQKQPCVEVDWTLRAADRLSQRRALAEKWLEEDQYTHYRYNVETCRDGKKVYLLRPTFLNKGFDFQVNVEGFKSTTRKARKLTAEMPSHPDVGQDFKEKLKAHPDCRDELFAALCDVYDCVEPDVILRNRPSLEAVNTGLSIDTLLKIVKWLFIEQDLTYWLQSGRNMLMAGLERDVFGLDADLKVTDG